DRPPGEDGGPMTHADEHELLDLATKVAAEAAPGEQVEAFVGSSTTTSVRVHGGEVESLTQATTSGIGVRVVRDGRQGFAYAGSLAPDVVEPPGVELWRDELAAMPADRKVALALELERAVRSRDPRISGVRVAQWGDGAGGAAVATSTGIAVSGRSTVCHLSVQALAAD